MQSFAPSLPPATQWGKKKRCFACNKLEMLKATEIEFEQPLECISFISTSFKSLSDEIASIALEIRVVALDVGRLRPRAVTQRNLSFTLP